MKKFILLFVLSFPFTLLFAQSVAFQRAATLGKGISLSWLEGYQSSNPANNYANYFDMNLLPSRKGELLVMKQMGIKTLRLPVWFEGWYSNSSTNPVLLTPQYYKAIDSLVRWTGDVGMNIIIDYHQAALNSANEVSESVRIANIWKQIARRYASTDPNRVFFEIYNEPSDISTAEWRNAANLIIQSIRTVTSAHTIITGGGNFNDIKSLVEMGTLIDNNVIYTFHFYEPFIFSHQGANPGTVNGLPLTTTGLPFPYNAATMPPRNPLSTGTWGEAAYNRYPSEATSAGVVEQLRVAYQWQINNQRPVYCGEFGSISASVDESSRCRYTKIIRTTLEGWQIPFALWEWGRGFGIFTSNTPSLNAIPDCFKDAWGITNTVVVPPPPGNAGNDLSVTLSADVAAYKLYSTINYTVSVKSNSPSRFSNVQISFPFPSNTVNGGTARVSQGKWSEFCNGGIRCYTWTIPLLSSNSTETMTLPLFVISTSQPIVATAKLLASAPTDGQINNNQSSLTLNRDAQNFLVQANKPTSFVPVVIQSIEPTLTAGDMNLLLESIVAEETTFSIYNSMGLVVKKLSLPVEKGDNKLPIDVWDLPQGMYFIAIDGVTTLRVPMKFVKM